MSFVAGLLEIRPLEGSRVNLHDMALSARGPRAPASEIPGMWCRRCCGRISLCGIFQSIKLYLYGTFHRYVKCHPRCKHVARLSVFVDDTTCFCCFLGLVKCYMKNFCKALVGTTHRTTIWTAIGRFLAATEPNHDNVHVDSLGIFLFLYPKPLNSPLLIHEHGIRPISHLSDKLPIVLTSPNANRNSNPNGRSGLWAVPLYSQWKLIGVENFKLPESIYYWT